VSHGIGVTKFTRVELLETRNLIISSSICICLSSLAHTLLAPLLFVDMSAMFLKLPGLLLLHHEIFPVRRSTISQPYHLQGTANIRAMLLDVRDARDASKCFFKASILIVDVGMKNMVSDKWSDICSPAIYLSITNLLYSTRIVDYELTSLRAQLRLLSGAGAAAEMPLNECLVEYLPTDSPIAVYTKHITLLRAGKPYVHVAHGSVHEQVYYLNCSGTPAAKARKLVSS
jgi:hypothetical protein